MKNLDLLKQKLSVIASSSILSNFVVNTIDNTIAVLNEQQEEIENLRQTAQSMVEGVCLLKEQEVKTGHWISVNDGDAVVIDNDGFPERACYCSECKKYLIASDEYAVYGRYCPFCGAKMEGWRSE